MCITNTSHTTHPATTPAVNQLQYSVGQGSSTVIQTDAKIGLESISKAPIIVQAYSPLGSGQVLSNPTVLGIAQAHNKSAAQVALRWIIQRGATINTQSTNPEHLLQDIQIFDFHLTSSEMAKLNAIQGLADHA